MRSRTSRSGCSISRLLRKLNIQGSHLPSKDNSLVPQLRRQLCLTLGEGLKLLLRRCLALLPQNFQPSPQGFGSCINIFDLLLQLLHLAGATLRLCGFLTPTGQVGLRTIHNPHPLGLLRLQGDALDDPLLGSNQLAEPHDLHPGWAQPLQLLSQQDRCLGHFIDPLLHIPGLRQRRPKPLQLLPHLNNQLPLGPVPRVRSADFVDHPTPSPGTLEFQLSFRLRPTLPRKLSNLEFHNSVLLAEPLLLRVPPPPLLPEQLQSLRCSRQPIKELFILLLDPGQYPVLAVYFLFHRSQQIVPLRGRLCRDLVDGASPGKRRSTNSSELNDHRPQQAVAS
mmetsp:Transcript_123874/g.284119  ORF Transcript_123874/g.284119 Transcript_123874/m.284119 type:complete len:337 (+) Transcript_123874:507-1517(+)